MSIKDLSPEDLAMLTEEERAGLEEDDEDEGDENDGADDKGQGDEGQGDDDDAGSGDGKEGGDEGKTADEGSGDGADPASDTDGVNNDNPAAVEDDKVTPPPQPLFKADLPADIEAKRQAIDTKEDDLIAKFDEGDITFAEYNKQIRELNKERSALDRAELKAELAAEAAQSQSEQSWQQTAQSFVADHPLIAKNETTWTSFDAVLRRITAETMEKGGQPGTRELEKAYKQWTADLGITETTEQKQDPAPQQKQKKANVVPPTLGKVPAATANDTDDGKFAHLDRLADSDPLAFEAALAKMTEAQLNEYMNAG